MEYKKMMLKEAIDFNPKESLAKGTLSKKISMDLLKPFHKFIESYYLEVYSGGAKFRNNDTIMARITPCLENGKTSFVDILNDNEVGFGSTEYIVLRSKENITIPEFVYYLSISKSFREKAISLMTGTSGRQRVELEPLKELNFSIPSLKEQSKIVKILSSIDNKIKLNNQINNNLLEIINVLYIEYISSIEDYEILDIRDIFDFSTGVEPGSKNYLDNKKDNTIKFYRVGDMNSKCKTFIKQELAKDKIVNKDDILVSFDATIGRIAFGVEGSYSTGIKKISINSNYNDILDNSIIFAYFNNKEIQDIMLQYASGTTILHAGASIEHLNFKYNKEILLKYFPVISNLFEKMKIIKSENQYLEQLRDTLLPKLMNGEIDLENIEI